MVGPLVKLVSCLALRALACLAFAALGAHGAMATEDAGSATDGKVLLQQNCARCHAIDATGASPLEGAPPLREVYLKYPIEQLDYGFAEGMGSKHRDMPQIQFSTEQVAAILAYLGSITGVPPSDRPTTDVPDETEPP